VQRANDKTPAASSALADTWSAEAESADTLLAPLRRLSGTPRVNAKCRLTQSGLVP
jgi:hypothetical protein